MQFRYDSEHDQLRSAVHEFLEDASSEQDVRRAMESPEGWDRSVFKRLASELGVLGLAVPEEYGGSGFGVLELGVVMQEAGRALLCAPLLSGQLAARTLLASGDVGACREHLPRIVDGEVIATLAALEPDVPWCGTPRLQAVQSPDGWVLTGEKDWVLDGSTASLLIVSATTSAGTSLFLVEGRAAGVAVEPLTTVDPTRQAARVTLTRARGVLLGSDGDGDATITSVRDFGVVLLAAEQLGIAERCLEMATQYAKDREQFGRPIGSFQAIKHKLADVLVEVEAASAAVLYGLWATDERPAELATVACVVGSTCSEAALLAAGENVQVHGGMGATWEHPAHLYLKRATLDRQLLGDPQEHRERLAQLVGLGSVTMTDTDVTPTLPAGL